MVSKHLRNTDGVSGRISGVNYGADTVLVMWVSRDIM